MIAVAGYLNFSSRDVTLDEDTVAEGATGNGDDAESGLITKGFSDAVVNISENDVDVVIKKAELTDTEKAQIEDIVARKTGYSIDKIIITTVEK